MLYIRRVLGQGIYSVYDTDDNTSETVNLMDLHNAISAGIKIEGVTVSERRINSKVMWAIEDVRVYQRPDDAKQTKIKVVLGIEVSLSKDTVTNIRWDTVIRDGSKLRISKYFKKLSNFVLDLNSPVNENRLVLVLDDNIKFHLQTFKYFDRHNLVLDVREVSDDSLVFALYQDAFRSSSSLAFTRIVDKPERRALIDAFRYVVGDIPAAPKDATPEMWTKVFTMLTPWFTKVFIPKRILIGERKNSEPFQSYAKMIFADRAYWGRKFDAQDFQLVFAQTGCYLPCFHDIIEIHSKRLVWFIKLAEQVEPPEDVQRLYVQFISAVNARIYSYNLRGTPLEGM